MLFKFTSADLHNATIIDCSTGAVVYRISTAVPGGRSRSLSASSLYSFASSSSSSRERLSSGSQKVTTLSSREGLGLAEITWEENRASLIRIGEEVLAGSAEIFDAAFIKVLPEETLIPTRMEYVWRTTPDSLTLLDDDGEVIGKLHADCISLEDELFPASKTGAGHSYLELGMIPPTEVLELLGIELSLD
ncbi:hypothetical protein EW026_g2883 [Hermanssonia centrifuga]|uniref:Uncharacterized protein n=1 Tax=Hermanssonia centrifuga TaxID=98765 RepID=A0A4S4KLU6_9APHY|nr:hypothetical protein EW026_g2883 [Hermanssonia centrifuga]